MLLTVTLLDINDNEPGFSQGHYNVSVMENAADQTILATIQATDKDVNRTITYGILPGNEPTSSFIIHHGIVFHFCAEE